ncbi:hypothetical protein D3C87_1832860 [compost metagenome]
MAMAAAAETICRALTFIAQSEPASILRSFLGSRLSICARVKVFLLLAVASSMLLSAELTVPDSPWNSRMEDSSCGIVSLASSTSS